MALGQQVFGIQNKTVKTFVKIGKTFLETALGIFKTAETTVFEPCSDRQPAALSAAKAGKAISKAK